MQYWFSSDYHFFHHNIIKYENRPFKNVEEMNNTIIKRQNERVKKDDILFFLGDLGFYASSNKVERGEGMPMRALDLFNQINGIKYRVCGNHDKRANKLKIPIHSIYLNMSGMSVQLIHNYEHANLENNLILCGHSHGKFQTKEVVNKHGVPVLIINTCVENKNYYPFSWDEIMSIWSVWLKNHPKRKIILSNLQKEK